MNNLIDQNSHWLRENGSGNASHTLKYQSFIKSNQDISITTKEGDVVTISLNRQEREELFEYDYTSNLKNNGREYSKISSDSLRVEVKGDLSAEEQKEIDEILKKTDNIMKAMIDGDAETIDILTDKLINGNRETISGMEATLKFQQQTYIEEKVTVQNQYLDEGTMNEIVDSISSTISQLLEHSKVSLKKSVPAVTEYLENLATKHDKDSTYRTMQEEAIYSIKDNVENLLKK